MNHLQHLLVGCEASQRGQKSGGEIKKEIGKTLIKLIKKVLSNLIMITEINSQGNMRGLRLLLKLKLKNK